MSLISNLFRTEQLPATKHYRSEDGSELFTFHFTTEADHVAIHCLRHPPLGHRDPDVHKTHLYSSGQICFVAGREPQNLSQALRLAKQWAEYFLQYRRTGTAQS